jgi:hypothetical protein
MASIELVSEYGVNLQGNRSPESILLELPLLNHLHRFKIQNKKQMFSIQVL